MKEREVKEGDSKERRGKAGRMDTSIAQFQAHIMNGDNANQYRQHSISLVANLRKTLIDVLQNAYFKL